MQARAIVLAMSSATALWNGMRLVVACVCAALLVSVAGTSAATRSPAGERQGYYSRALWVRDLSGRELARWPPGLPPGKDPSDRISVDSILGDGSGGFFVSGSFARIAGLRCVSFAHIVPPGKLDRRWCLNPNGRVKTIQRSGERLQIGGLFTEFAGVRRQGVAVFALDTASPLLARQGEIQPLPAKTFVADGKTGKPLRGRNWEPAVRALDVWARGLSVHNPASVSAAVRQGRWVYALVKNAGALCRLARYDLREPKVTMLAEHIGCAAITLAISGEHIGLGAWITRSG